MIPLSTDDLVMIVFTAVCVTFVFAVTCTNIFKSKTYKKLYEIMSNSKMCANNLNLVNENYVFFLSEEGKELNLQKGNKIVSLKYILSSNDHNDLLSFFYNKKEDLQWKNQEKVEVEKFKEIVSLD